MHTTQPTEVEARAVVTLNGRPIASFRYESDAIDFFRSTALAVTTRSDLARTLMATGRVEARDGFVTCELIPCECCGHHRCHCAGCPIVNGSCEVCDQ